MSTKFTDFKPEELTFTEWADPERFKSQQKMSFHRYGPNGDNLFLQLPWMNIFKYGVPSIGEYYSEDRDRAFLKMPIDKSDPNSKILFDKLVKFDELMQNDDFKTKMFGKKAKKYSFIPVVKNTEEDDDDDSPPWMKVKIHYYEDTVHTQVFKSEVISEDANGKQKRKRTPVDVSTIQDFQDIVRYRSNVRLIIKPTKLWAQSENLKDPTYGVAWRITKVEVEPLPELKGNNNNDFIDSDLSDEEGDGDGEAPKLNVKGANNDKESSDEDSDDSDEDSDSEDDAPPSPVLKKKKSKAKNA